MEEVEFGFIPNDPYYSDWDGHEEMVWGQETVEPVEEEEEDD
jgi:hypothetical protein